MAKNTPLKDRMFEVVSKMLNGETSGDEIKVKIYNALDEIILEKTLDEFSTEFAKYFDAEEEKETNFDSDKK